MRRIALLAATAVAVLAPAPIAGAAEPAADEYTLEIPGVRDNALDGATQADAEETSSAVEQAGVAGESGSASSPLGSILSALGEAPLAIAVLLLAAAGLAVSTARTTRQPRTG